jgi:ribonuclease-3
MRRATKSDTTQKAAQQDNGRAAVGVSKAKDASNKDAKSEARSDGKTAAKPDTKFDAKPVAKPVAKSVARSVEGKATGSKPAAAGAKRPGSKRRLAAASALETTIGYRFRDRELLDRSLTHISALAGGNRVQSYQRLEFLGDHVLGLIVSDMLFRAFPKADEGELSRRLADLVRREACADVARAIDLGSALRLGTSEANAGGRSRPAILADVCEAVVGAVYLDGGYEAATKLVANLWGERMRRPVRPLRDAKTMLQEWAQARGLPTPTYREVERTGPHHDPEFRVAVALPDIEPAEGLGRSKRAAEQAAAAAMLKREGVRTERADG